MRNLLLAKLICLAVCVLLPTNAYGTLTLLNTYFAFGGTIDIGFDQESDSVYVYNVLQPNILILDRFGNQTGTISQPGTLSNSFGLDFTQEALTIGGTSIEKNTLLAFNGNDVPNRMYAVDKSDGSIEAFLSIPASLTEGGAHHGSRGTIYSLHWNTTDILEIDPVTGFLLNSFNANPAGSTPMGIFYGDVDILAATGNLYVIASAHGFIRELTSTGDFVQDIDVASLGVAFMTGIAFDDKRGEAWISSTTGAIYHLGGFAAVPEPSSFMLIGSASLGVCGMRRKLKDCRGDVR